jgi:hypothetical protein
MVLDSITALAHIGLAVLAPTHEPDQAFAVAIHVAAIGHGGRFITGFVEAVLAADTSVRFTDCLWRWSEHRPGVSSSAPLRLCITVTGGLVYPNRETHGENLSCRRHASP